MPMLAMWTRKSLIMLMLAKSTRTPLIMPMLAMSTRTPLIISMLAMSTRKSSDELELRCGDWDLAGEESTNEVMLNEFYSSDDLCCLIWGDTQWGDVQWVQTWYLSNLLHKRVSSKYENLFLPKEYISSAKVNDLFVFSSQFVQVGLFQILTGFITMNLCLLYLCTVYIQDDSFDCTPQNPYSTHSISGSLHETHIF